MRRQTRHPPQSQAGATKKHDPEIAYRVEHLAAMSARNEEAILGASCEALLAQVAHRDRAFSERLTHWLLGIWEEYSVKKMDPNEGPIAARVWAEHALRSGPRRPSRSEEQDARMVQLRDELRPLFTRKRKLASRKAKDAEVRSIIERVCGAQIAKKVHGYPLMSVQETLAVCKFGDAAQQSRRAGRKRQRDTSLLARQDRWIRIMDEVPDSVLSAQGRLFIKHLSTALHRDATRLRTQIPEARRLDALRQPIEDRGRPLSSG